MTVNDPLPQCSTTGVAQRPKKRKAIASRSRLALHPSPSVSAAPQNASSTQESEYYTAPLTASNLALAGALNAPPIGNGGPMASGPCARNDNYSSSDVTNTTYSEPPRPALAPRTPLSAHAQPRLIIRIPSLAARRALAQTRSDSLTPAIAARPHKRARSPTPDSEEDDFAASFMRKRRVSAAMF